MTDMTPEYNAKVIAAAPFADNEAGIPQMVDLIKALAARIVEVEAERDGFYADWEAALKLANRSANLMAKMDADRLEHKARAEKAEAEVARLSTAAGAAGVLLGLMNFKVPTENVCVWSPVYTAIIAAPTPWHGFADALRALAQGAPK